MLLLAVTYKHGFALVQWAGLVLVWNVFFLLRKTCCSERIFFFHKWDSSVCVVYHLRRNEEMLRKGHAQALPHLKGKLELFLKGPSLGLGDKKTTRVRAFPLACSQDFLKGLLVFPPCSSDCGVASPLLCSWRAHRRARCVGQGCSSGIRLWYTKGLAVFIPQLQRGRGTTEKCCERFANTLLSSCE